MTAAARGVPVEFLEAGRRFGPIVALAPLSLRFDAGQRVLLLGPNGAGKSTLLRVAGGLARPTSGRVQVGGTDLRGAKSARARAAIGYLGHRSFLFEHLTARENLLLYARLYGLGREAAARADRMLDEVGLGVAAQRVVRGFSRGMLQRLGLARALLHAPALLLLDEPTTGLDPDGRRRLDALLGQLRGGPTLALVSHRAEAALPLVDRVVVLQRGRVVADGPSSERDAQGWTALAAAPAARGAA
ncbi:MAG: ABC transporter ATP-binding protein [Acidobacteria bacterium]|nr:ABC transporter ATP-binding protein [Acidobacteriota bacterium]